jgi:integrase/recombinase XerD
MKQEKINACGGSPLKTYKQYLQSKGQSNSTVKTNTKNLLNFITWADGENIEIETAEHREILSYIKHLQKRGIKQRTIKSYLISISHYNHWQIKQGHRKTNPVKKIKLKGIEPSNLHEILTKQELETLYNQYLQSHPEQSRRTPTEVQKRNKIIIGLLIYQGLGTGELANLEQADIKLREAQIYIAGGRRSNERTLKLESTQILDLMEYKLQIENKEPQNELKELQKLIQSTGTSTKIHNLLTGLMKQLTNQNPKVTSIKQLRASVIVNWLKHYNLRETQYRAGHRYVSSTENYQINNLEELQEDITKYHPL